MSRKKTTTYVKRFGREEVTNQRDAGSGSQIQPLERAASVVSDGGSSVQFLKRVDYVPKKKTWLSPKVREIMRAMGALSSEDSEDGAGSVADGNGSSGIEFAGMVTGKIPKCPTTKKPSNPVLPATSDVSSSGIELLGKTTAASPQGADSRKNPEPQAIQNATEERNGSSDSNELPPVGYASSTSSLMSDSVSLRLAKYELQKSLWEKYGGDQSADQQKIGDKRTNQDEAMDENDEIPPKKTRGADGMEKSAEIEENSKPDSGYLWALPDRGDMLCLEKDPAVFTAWQKKNGFFLSLYGYSLAVGDYWEQTMEAWRFNGSDDPGCPYDEYGQPIPEKIEVKLEAQESPSMEV